MLDYCKNTCKQKNLEELVKKHFSKIVRKKYNALEMYFSFKKYKQKKITFALKLFEDS
jgi:hypothetical protein